MYAITDGVKGIKILIERKVEVRVEETRVA
jgi:hypothetical protein